MFDLLFDFDELPLETLYGLTITTVSGQATISFTQDGDYGVTDIWLSGWRRKSEAERRSEEIAKGRATAFVEQLIPLDAAGRHYATIKAALIAFRADRISDEIADALAERRGSLPATRAERRRELMAGV